MKKISLLVLLLCFSVVTMYAQMYAVASISTVTYAAQQKANTTIRITDVTGNCVSVTDLGMQQSGSAAISLTTLASGTYMVTVTSGNEKSVKQLVKG